MWPMSFSGMGLSILRRKSILRPMNVSGGTSRVEMRSGRSTPTAGRSAS
jgi:hypothetical protein